MIDDWARVWKRFSTQITNGIVARNMTFDNMTRKGRLLRKYCVAGAALKIDLNIRNIRELVISMNSQSSYFISIISGVAIGLNIVDIKHSFSWMLGFLLVGSKFFFGWVHFITGKTHKLRFAMAGSNVVRKMTRMQKWFATVFADETAFFRTTYSNLGPSYLSLLPLVSDSNTA